MAASPRRDAGGRGLPQNNDHNNPAGAAAAAADSPAAETAPWRRAVVHSVGKRFGAVKALDDVHVEFRTGSVHGLLGQNGAGKSTLIKVLTGLVRPDEGHLEVDGVPTGFGGDGSAGGWAVSTAYQELTLVPHLSVAENLVLGRERAYRVRSFESAVAAASAILQRWHVTDIDPRKPVKNSPLPVQQRLEIVRALERTDRVLILDEPTSALDPAGADWLKERIREQCDRGVAIIIVSHRLAEIEDVCDHVTVLRDGRAVASLPAEGLNAQKIAALMLGRELLETQTAIARQHDHQPTAAPEVIAVRELAAAPILRNVTFALHQGEILGVAGLEGQGQHELFMTMFGGRRPTAGQILVAGRSTWLRSPRSAIKAGIGMVPEDRKVEGLLLHRPIRENLSLPALRQLSTGGIMSRTKEAAAAAPAMASLGLASRVYHNLAGSLSGGNQQKVVAAKWLVADSQVLLMYDPLRGVDVGARQEFFAWMTQFARSGGSVLFYSSDIDELTTVCDRVITVYRGLVTTELAGHDITRERVLAGMLGETP